MLVPFWLRSHLNFWLRSHFGSSIPSQEQPHQSCARNLDTALHILAQLSLQPRPFIIFPLGQLERQSAKGEWLRDEAETKYSEIGSKMVRMAEHQVAFIFYAGGSWPGQTAPWRGVKGHSANGTSVEGKQPPCQ